MTRLLMLVHGMGVHRADWATDTIADLTTAAKPYGLDDEFSATFGDATVTLAPITYDDRFTKWLAKWGNDSTELAKFIRKQSIDVPANIVGSLGAI